MPPKTPWIGMPNSDNVADQTTTLDETTVMVPAASKSLVVNLLFIVANVAPLDAHAQSMPKRVFSTSESCELSGALTSGECRYARTNALAELDEKSPRFATRDECQRAFVQCMIAGLFERRLQFQPAMRGFEINSRSHEKTVVPVLYVESAFLGFRPRAVSRPDIGISGSERARAQARWAQMMQAKAASDAQAKKALEPQDNDLQFGNAAAESTVKPRQPSQYDIESAARRRKEIESAPFVP